MCYNRLCKTAVSAVVAVFIFLAGSQYARAGSASSLHMSVTVVEDCIVSNTDRINIAGNSGGRSGGATDFEFLCGLNVPYQVQLAAGNNGLFDGIMTEDGFGGMFHVEVSEDGSYKVEKCDSLSDMPATAKGPAASDLIKDAAQGGLNAGTVNVTVQW